MARQGKTQIAKLVNPWKKLVSSSSAAALETCTWRSSFQKRRDPDIEVIAATLTTPLAGPARSHRTGSVSRRP
jgi:hypothetical protein